MVWSPVSGHDGVTKTNFCKLETIMFNYVSCFALELKHAFLSVTETEQFKAVGLAPVSDLTNLNVFQGNDPSWLLICGELKIVKTVVVEDEPSSLPAFVSAPLLPRIQL